MLHVLVLKSVVAFMVFTRLRNGCIATKDEVASVALLHLSLIGGFVATTVEMMLRKNVIVMNARNIRMDDMDGNRENMTVVVLVYRYYKFRMDNVWCVIL